MLLTKRLLRSLWRTKLRLSAVVLMIVLGVFAGISFGAYGNATVTMYDDIYTDEEGRINLADLVVETPGGIWNGSTPDDLCQSIDEDWSHTSLELGFCEPRLTLDGLMFDRLDDGSEQMVRAIWYGIDEGDVNRVWMPENDCCKGQMATAADEIVLDSHAASAMNIDVGDNISISAGAGRMNFTVVGTGMYADHLYFAETGQLTPAAEGTFATGYLSASGLESLANRTSGTSNILLIDIQGTPSYDLQSTPEVNEGVKLNEVKAMISEIVSQGSDTPIFVYDQAGMEFVELLRADAEGANEIYPYVAGMIAVVAGITIFLSLQRLIQSQAKEIAVLRTLGVPRRSIMPGYILAPMVIGSVGAAIGTALGAWVGAPGMIDLYEDIIGIPIIGYKVPSSLIVQNVMIVMVIVLLSGIRPAWQAAHLQPLEVLRGQHEVRLSSRRIQRWTAKLPATVGLTIRSSIRKPVRLAFTFFAVGISMLIFGSMLLMMGSMEEIFGNERETWDAKAYAPTDGEGLIIQWAEEKGASHELLLEYPASPGLDDSRQLLANGLDQFSGIDSQDGMIHLKLKDGSFPVADSSITEVLIDEGTSQFLEWKVGDQPTIAFGTMTEQVEIVGITKGELFRTVYFHRSDLAESVGLNVTSVLIDLPEGVEIDTEIGAISEGITLMEDQRKSLDHLLEQQNQFLIAIIGLGILMAIGVLFNTLVMNLAERDSELATLRVLGAPIKRLGLMIFGEHLAIGVIGGILACLFAVFGTQMLIGSQVQWAFYFTIQVSILPILIIGGTVVLMSISLTPFGMWRIRRMDLVEISKRFAQ
mgnify:FL=1